MEIFKYKPSFFDGMVNLEEFCGRFFELSKISTNLNKRRSNANRLVYDLSEKQGLNRLDFWKPNTTEEIHVCYYIAYRVKDVLDNPNILDFMTKVARTWGYQAGIEENEGNYYLTLSKSVNLIDISCFAEQMGFINKVMDLRLSQTDFA